MQKTLILALMFWSWSASAELVNYTWHFYGQKLKLSLDIKPELYQRYLNEPRPSQTLTKDDYYTSFLVPKSGDNLISMLAKQLRAFASQYRLNSNQLAECAISFVQSLPYNEAECGATAIAVCDYPYVTLARGRGTCLDKAILASALLKDLGYGIAMIYFDQIRVNETKFDQHVVLGLETKSPLAFFGAKYCFVELDTYATIGRVTKVLPQGFLIDDPQAANLKQNRLNAERMGPYKLYLVSAGTPYY